MSWNKFAGTGLGVMQGASTGAALGSLIPIPGVGTAIGATIGGIWGGISGYGQAEAAENAADEETRKKAERDNTIADIIAEIQNRKNPYAIDNPEFQKSVAMQRRGLVSSFGDQRGQLESNMAARGLLGSGQEVGAKTGLAAAQAGAVSNLNTGLVQQQQDRFNAFEDNRASQLTSAKQGKIDALNQDLTTLAGQQQAYNQNLAQSARDTVGLLANKDVQANLKEGFGGIGHGINQGAGMVQQGVDQVGGLLTPRMPDIGQVRMSASPAAPVAPKPIAPKPIAMPSSLNPSVARLSGKPVLGASVQRPAPSMPTVSNPNPKPRYGLGSLSIAR